jgi:DNA-binding Lrp family transcriptional regulator
MRYSGLLSELRKDARASVPLLAEKLGIAQSTAYDRIRRMESFITKYTALIDFRKLGYGSHSYFVLRAQPDDRKLYCDILSSHPNVNNLFWISSQDLLGEALFKSPLDEDLFYSELASDRKTLVTRFPVIDQVTREKLLTSDDENNLPGIKRT